MVDLSAFSDEKFDPKKWINGALQQRHPQDPVEKQLVDLEMKLQVVSEEIAASLEEQSSAAILRVPRASRDVLRLRDEALSLRSSVASILLFLKKVSNSLPMHCSHYCSSYLCYILFSSLFYLFLLGTVVFRSKYLIFFKQNCFMLKNVEKTIN